ncbi:M20/M25/M40 family metallo-hydrolase [Angelakisella massiliensis]|uniref:M20/M25/M40 family metallo-hydrolase n=1 Tax=Angelakisella massiliensis TaxID=1871018 RepID=UPI0008F84106|nr:M20/M25/M40 family metallo-hydrolase [Angelakisella massiliensis]
MELNQEISQYIQDHSGEALELLTTLAAIPAPSNQEEKRVEFCRSWLRQQGASEVLVDPALNVICPVGNWKEGPVSIFMAHTDVVFPDTDLLPVVRDGNILRAPGVGDDTANLTALLMAAKFVLQRGLVPREGGVLFVANSGEEGLGNLKGSRQLMADYGKRTRQVISFDGGTGGIINRAVGSRRYRVEIRTEGGHSYGDFGNRNAIAVMASLIDALYAVKVPQGGRTTFNVGVIKGGTSVNTIAQQAEMLYEFRSDCREDLEIMERHFQALIAAWQTKGVTVEVQLVGERPTMGPVDPAAQQALVEQICAATRRWSDQELRLKSGSTDCNIPLSMGIPSACTGCYIGGGAHTREEWLRIDSLEAGLHLAFDLVLQAF